MPELTFRLVLQDDGVTKKLQVVRDEAEKTRLKIEDPASLVVVTEGADGKLKAVAAQAETTQKTIEQPAEVRVSATQSLATLRDLSITLQGVLTAFSGLTRGLNSFLDAALTQTQAQILANQAFGAGADAMARYASEMQNLTNFGDEELLVLMAKMASTYKLSTDEIQLLTPSLLDFAEANKATGMTIESAFDLMGRALNGHTEMLGRHGIELDDNRLKMEGVSYLVEKLSGDYGGTAQALADLRLQNQNTWGDIREEIGSFLSQAISPILSGLRVLMQAWQGLPPVLKGVTAGLALAVPVVIALATAITTATAAVVALKTAINPVVGIMSLVVGGLTAGAVAAGAYAASHAAAAETVDDFSTSHNTLVQSLQDADTSATREADSFNLLASTLLDLKSKTNLTAQEKTTLATTIRTLNSNYSEYLGNINLEKASYDELTISLRVASQALMDKKLAESYGNIYSEQIDKIARLQTRINELVKNGQDNYLQYVQDRENLQGGMGDYQKLSPEALMNAEITNLRTQLQGAKDDLKLIEDQWKKTAGGLSVPGAGSGSGSGTGSGVNAAEQEAKRLIESLADLRRSETDRIEFEYQKRLILIKQFTLDGSDAEKSALSDLEAWKTAKQTELQTKEKADQQAAFRANIDYYSNLESLGVSSYEALKHEMEAYYAWAQQNLPEKEQQLILAQLRETNLRYGQHLQEKKDKEEAHLRELQDIRDEFAKKTNDLDANVYANRLLELDRYYERAHAKMIEAGLTEEQIEEQKQHSINAIKAQFVEQGATGISRILANLASAQDKETRKGFATWKALAIAQGYVDTFASAIAAYKSMVGIPGVGPVLGAAAATAALVAGLANISRISAQRFEPPKAATGGYIQGPSHSRGGVIIEAEGDEYITRKDRVQSLGKRFFDFLNFAPLDAVRKALGTIQIPMPALAQDTDGGGSYSFAGGGSVPSNTSLMALLSKLNDKLDALAKPQISIHVDPLSNHPVKISEIAQRGDLIRSTF